MSEYIEELTEAMKKIVEVGWHNSTRNGNTGIGKTFEDLLDKEEDNLSLPDFGDIEIKTNEQASNSMITLFTKAPSFPRGANTMLRKKYGKADGTENILHATVSGNKITNSSEYAYNFKINVNRTEERIELEVYDADGILVDNSVFWKFSVIGTAIKKKLKYIGIVSADSRINSEGVKQYNYREITLIEGLTVEGLVGALETGDLKVDVRVGIYRTGKKIGKTHDHGTAFRISLSNLLTYSEVIEI